MDVCSVTQYGWIKDEVSKTVIPVTTPSDVALAPPYILEMIRCGCASDEPCQSAHAVFNCIIVFSVQ